MEPINQLKFFFDCAILLLSLVASIVSLLVVMRTEKELKRTFEFFFASFAILFLASIIEMNKYFGAISSMQAKWVLIMSRFIALCLSTTAMVVMLHLARKQIKYTQNEAGEMK